MKNRQIRSIKRSIRHGNRRFVLRQIATSKERVKADLSRLAEALHEAARQYAEQRAVWTGELPAPHLRPVALSEQLRVMRLALVGALIAQLLEVLLAGLLTNWAPGPVMLAALAPFALKAALLLVVRNENQPQEAVRQIKTWIVTPALVAFFIALTLSLLARLLPLAGASLQTVMSSGIFVMSLSALTTVIGLFALAHLYGWSRETAQHFQTLETELINTRELFRYILAREAELGQPPSSGTAGRSGNFPSIPKAAMWVLAGFIPLVSNACQREQFSAPLKAAQANPPCALPATSAQARLATDLVVKLDRSASQTQQSVKAAYDALLRQLPSLCEQYGVRHVSIDEFTSDGWASVPRHSLELPEFKAPQLEGQAQSEIELFLAKPNQTLAQQRCQQYQRRFDEDKAAYRRQVAASLAPLAAANLSTDEQVSRSGCTDLNGALARVSRLDTRQRRQLVLLLTDGEESCTRRLAAVARPAGPLALGVILTTSRSGPTAYEQFELRRQLISQAVPWAAIGSYNDDAYERTVAEALALAAVPIQVAQSTPPLAGS